MPEHRISFTPAELDVLRAVLDHALSEIDGRLGSAHAHSIDTAALRIAKQEIARLRSKIFPARPVAVPHVVRA